MERTRIDPKLVSGWRGLLHLQGRHPCSLAAIERYVLDFIEGRTVRPITLQRSGETGTLYLDEGHHRLCAALLTRQELVDVEIYDEFSNEYLDRDETSDDPCDWEDSNTTDFTKIKTQISSLSEDELQRRVLALRTRQEVENEQRA